MDKEKILKSEIDTNIHESKKRRKKRREERKIIFEVSRIRMPSSL